MLNIESLRQEIMSTLNSGTSLTVYRGGVPTTETIRYQNGKLIPYAVCNFSEVIPGRDRSFIGSRGDGYVFVFRVYVIAKDVEIAENWQSRIDDLMIGFAPTNSGEINKRFGGGVYTMYNERGGIEAFTTAATYNFQMQLMQQPDPVPPGS